jgi:hypothetical protein
MDKKNRKERGHTVRRENTHMTSPDKLLVIQSEDRVVCIQEFRMEDNLDPITRPVEQLDPSNLVEDGIVGIVGHVVGSNGRERVSLKGEYSSFEEDLVFLGEEIFGSGDLGSVFTKSQPRASVASERWAYHRATPGSGSHRRESVGWVAA